jgi:Xaa-Pro aminopeptidase
MDEMKEPCADRARRVRRELHSRRLGGLVVTSPVDVGYLSGFSGDDSWLLVGRRTVTLITDRRFDEQAERETRGVRIVVRKGPLAEALGGEMKGRSGRWLGFDPESVSVAVKGRLRKALGRVRLVEAPGLVGGLRVRKDAFEQRTIRRAIRVAEAAWREFRNRIRPGMTERLLATELDHQMRLAGADGPAFPTICAIDASAAMPHAVPGNRRLRRGSVLLVDFGARVGGYVCDLTRTLFAGRIDPCARRVYEAVRAAQGAAVSRVHPGAAFTEVDAAARAVLGEAGLAGAFDHGTGHGIGREVHEPPTLGPRAGKGTLEPGMVVTIEPGVYLRGTFGIRIEDDCLVTKTGRRVLTRVEKDLEAMVL